MDKELQQQLQLSLKPAISATEKAQQAAITESTRPVGSIVANGCGIAFLSIVVGAVVVFNLVEGRGLKGLNDLFFFVVIGIPVVLILSFIIANVTMKRTIGAPTPKVYFAYQRVWVAELLHAFLQYQYTGMSAAVTDLRLKEIKMPQLYLFDRDKYKGTQYWATLTYSEADISVEADFYTWIRGENVTQFPDFKGIVYKIPYPQRYPDKRTFLIHKNSELLVSPSLQLLQPNETTAESDFGKRFKVYSDAVEHFQDLASTELIEYLLKLCKQGFSFIAVSASSNQLYLWLDWQKDICCPQLQAAVLDTIDETIWAEVVAIMPELAEIVKNRAKFKP